MSKKPPIRSRPDTLSEAGVTAKDPSGFIAEGDSAESTSPLAPQMTKFVAVSDPTIQKVFRLRWDIAQALAQSAATRSREEGRRVHEKDIVQDLLREHFRLPRSL